MSNVAALISEVITHLTPESYIEYGKFVQKLAECGAAKGFKSLPADLRNPARGFLNQVDLARLTQRDTCLQTHQLFAQYCGTVLSLCRQGLLEVDASGKGVLTIDPRQALSPRWDVQEVLADVAQAFADFSYTGKWTDVPDLAIQAGLQAYCKKPS